MNAAGKWQRSEINPPPKDGTWILGIFKDPSVVRWEKTKGYWMLHGTWVQGELVGSDYYSYAPDCWAPINLPYEFVLFTILLGHTPDYDQIDRLLTAWDGMLKTLTEREERIIRLRFGLDDGYPRTLQEIGTMFNVSRERVRQIEAKAIRKLRRLTTGSM